MSRKQFGQKLKLAVEATGLSVEQFCEQSNIDRNELENLINGIGVFEKISIARLGEALKLTPQQYYDLMELYY